MDRKKKVAITLPILVLLITALATFGEKSKASTYQHDSGLIFGTSYNITYESSENHKEEIEKILQGVDNSLSPFNNNSIITAVNQNKDITLDTQFIEVYKLAHSVYEETEGAFDITVAPLVNAWGFGFKSGKMPTEKDIDSLKNIIGLDKTSIDKSGKHIVKQDPRTMFDCSAIAKGYAVDMVARHLSQQGIENYMVEIGGEVIVKGHNQSGKPWRIGVTRPTDDSLAVNQEIQTVLTMTDRAMATSGNYRNFYYKNGKKYAHTIDPRTGYPIQHNILSATVFAPTCAEADAYATAFMVLGLDKAKRILSRKKTLSAYLIYTDDSGKNAVWYTKELKQDIDK